MWIMRYTTVHSQHSRWILMNIVYVRVRGHGNMRSQMKPQRDGRSGIWAHGKEKGGGGWGSQFDMINHVQQGGRQNQFDMIDHGSCVRPALNSFFLTRAMLSVLPFGKHDSGTQAKYPGSKGLLYNWPHLLRSCQNGEICLNCLVLSNQVGIWEPW